MIFYFSGTGNSRWVAENVATSFDDKVIAMSDFFHDGRLETPEFTVKPDEYIGFVFPVYSWGIPPLVGTFVERVCIHNYNNNRIFGIFTCGDECGNTHQMFLKLMQAKGWTCRHIYSVQMPNNYIFFPGFDVDSKELEKSKIEKAAQLLPTLTQAIRDDRPIIAYTKGNLTFLKSGLIYPLFVKYARDSRPFHTTDACTSCGLCAKLCPTKNITVADKPVWGKYCEQCLSCIHRCPSRAIEYGKISKKKGRYYFKNSTL